MYGTSDPAMGRRPGRSGGWWILLGVGLAVIAVLVIVFVLLANGVLGGSSPRPFWGFWGAFLLLFLIVWVGFFVLRVAFWSRRRQYGYGRGPGLHRDPAVMVARQRYARGEITREQYEQIMTDLGRRGRGPGGPLSGP